VLLKWVVFFRFLPFPWVTCVSQVWFRLEHTAIAIAVLGRLLGLALPILHRSPLRISSPVFNRSAVLLELATHQHCLTPGRSHGSTISWEFKEKAPSLFTRSTQAQPNSRRTVETRIGFAGVQSTQVLTHSCPHFLQSRPNSVSIGRNSQFAHLLSHGGLRTTIRVC